MEIKKVPFDKLLKLELSALARAVISIVEKHNPERLKVIESYNLLIAQTPNINLLKEPYGPHPLTKALIPVRKKCLMYARAIVYNMGIAVKENSSPLTQETAIAAAMVKQHLHRLDLCRSEDIVIESITGFFQEVTKDAKVLATFETLNLMADYDNLKIAHSAYKKLRMKRVKQLSERPKANTIELETLIRKALRDMFKHLEVSVFVNTKIDYAPIINEINQIIKVVKKDVNRRLLNNKKKALKDVMDKNHLNKKINNPKVNPTPPLNNDIVDKPSANKTLPTPKEKGGDI